MTRNYTATQCYQASLEFPPVKRRKIEADCFGGAITSKMAGFHSCPKLINRWGNPRAVGRALSDGRHQAWCDHSLLKLIKQRIQVYGLALGYEGLNDHQELRHDTALQTATSRMKVLASPSTLCPPSTAF